MSPFKNTYNFDIVRRTSVREPEDMPKYFLADTPEEAEAVYNEFAVLLNALAHNYAMSTNLSKADLFGEGLIGLGRASRDWDPDRSSFRTYATFRIKDAMVEFIRDRSATVRIPSYIKKANRLLQKLKWWCEVLGCEVHEAVKRGAFTGSGIVKDVDDEEPYFRVLGLAQTLREYSNRAKVKDINKFIERIDNLPEEVDFSDQTPPEIHAREQEMLEAALVVDKLKEHMNPDELKICKCIMEDKSYKEIGEELGKSKSWVAGKMDGLRNKIARRLKEGTL